MIGNKIKFRLFEFTNLEVKISEFEGIVVDAWTDVSGQFRSSSFMGFGDGKGETQSNRIYKVEFFKYGSSKHYEDIRANQLIEVLEFNFTKNPEEKFNQIIKK